MASNFLSRVDLWLYRTVLLLLLSTFSESVHVIPVFRLIQYTSVDTNLGSQRTGVNLLSGTWVPKESQDLSRRLVIIHYDQLNKESLDEILTEKKSGGVLVTLPNNATERIDPTSWTNWNTFEKYLISIEVKVPFYFTFEDEFLKQINADVSQSNTQELLHPLRDMYQLVVTSPEATVIQEITGNNYRGWLTGARTPGQEQQQTLAVVASYDALAAAPELAVGADSNASGLVALFELARLFSKLYTGYKTQGNYNLLFLVTGGGRQNSEGLKNWLASADSRLLDSIEFALCLDSLLPSSPDHQGLFLHVSKSAKEEKFQQIVAPFNNTAKWLGIPFQVVHKKINISDPTIYWEHELFSRKRIFAATLSHLSSPSPSFKRSNILDRSQAGDVAVLEKNVKFIAESLSQQIYKTKRKEVEVFDGFLSVNTFFLQSWLSTLTSFPRFLPYIPPTSPLYSFIERVLKEYTTEVTVQNFKIDNSEIKFYSSPANLTMSAYKVKPFTFDLLLFFLTLLYLVSLFVSLKGMSGAVASVKEFLSPTQSKKRR